MLHRRFRPLGNESRRVFNSEAQDTSGSTNLKGSGSVITGTATAVLVGDGSRRCALALSEQLGFHFPGLLSESLPLCLHLRLQEIIPFACPQAHSPGT